jgi:uncharacterized protein YjaZ
MENHKFFTQKPCDKPAKQHTNHTRHETQKKIQNCKTNAKNNSAPILIFPVSGANFKIASSQA